MDPAHPSGVHVTHPVPRVSVIIPFLDPPLRFFEEAVASVYAQSYADWELLLVDDGAGSPATAFARTEAQAHAGRVQHLVFDGLGHRGNSAARNLGLRQARGTYVATLDADDVWVPEKLARQVAILDDAPDVGWLYGTTRYWHGWTGGRRAKRRDHVKPHILHVTAGLRCAGRVEPPHLLALYLSDAVAVPSISSVMCRRLLALEVNGFEESFLLYEDQTFVAKLCLAAPVILSDECWDLYRQHSDSLSARMRGSELARRSRQRFLEWLTEYVAHQNVGDPVLDRALRRELRATRFGMVGKAVNRMLRRVERALPKLM